MALRPSFVDSHITDWHARLTSPFYPHRKHWPAKLFHHAPLDNAVAILKDGYLRSRNDASNNRPRDVAAPGVIDARAHAHNFVRLYFRPKTPTQWHIEGIRKAGECIYGDVTHAGVLVMFVLDARSVLLRPDVMFSDRNMQLSSTTPGNTEEYFSNIPFQKVYSEGSTGGDKTYTDARCAEVLTPSPLPLQECLTSILFRSEPERDTLLHMLGEDRRHWANLCQVSDALKVFQKEYTFVQEIRLAPDGVIFKFNPRKDRKNLEVSIKVWNSSGKSIVDFYNGSHAAVPNAPYDNWIWQTNLANDVYVVEVRLEGTLAFQGTAQLGDSLF